MGSAYGRGSVFESRSRHTTSEFEAPWRLTKWVKNFKSQSKWKVDFDCVTSKHSQHAMLCILFFLLSLQKSDIMWRGPRPQKFWILQRRDCIPRFWNSWISHWVLISKLEITKICKFYLGWTSDEYQIIMHVQNAGQRTAPPLSLGHTLLGMTRY